MTRRAGRPPAAPELKKMPIAIKLPQWLLDWMDLYVESRAVLIEEAMCTHYRITAPRVIPETEPQPHDPMTPAPERTSEPPPHAESR